MLDGPVWDVGVLNGGRWCDAYPLISDLVRRLYGARYSMWATTAMYGVGSRDSTHI